MTRRLVAVNDEVMAIARHEAQRLGIRPHEVLLAALRTGHHRHTHPPEVETRMDPGSLAGRIRAAESERAPLRYAAHEQLEANQMTAIRLPSATGEAVLARERARKAKLDIEPDFTLPDPRVDAWMERYLFRKPATGHPAGRDSS